MFRFTLRKMLSKKWMVLSLLIGNILLVSIASSNPMYMQAMLQRTLTKSLENYLIENNAYPGLITMRQRNSSKNAAQLTGYLESAENVPETFGVDAIESIVHLNLDTTKASLTIPRADVEDYISLGSMSDLPEHIELIAGRGYSEGPDENGIIDAILSERAMMEMKLLLDDVLVFENLLDSEGNPLRIRIAGVFKAASSDDAYWVRSPNHYPYECFLHPDLFETYFKNGGVHFQLTYVSREDLLCAKVSPDEYKNLRVRVTGFSDYFTRLQESMQDDIIERTTH